MNEHAPEVLILAAVKALHRAWRDGRQKHGEDGWRQVTVTEHLKHLERHLFAYQCGQRRDHQGHHHLSHLICRAAMVAVLDDLRLTVPTDKEQQS